MTDYDIEPLRGRCAFNVVGERGYRAPLNPYSASLRLPYGFVDDLSIRPPYDVIQKGLGYHAARS